MGKSFYQQMKSSRERHVEDLFKQLKENEARINPPGQQDLAKRLRDYRNTEVVNRATAKRADRFQLMQLHCASGFWNRVTHQFNKFALRRQMDAETEKEKLWNTFCYRGRWTP